MNVIKAKVKSHRTPSYFDPIEMLAMFKTKPKAGVSKIIFTEAP